MPNLIIKSLPIKLVPALGTYNNYPVIILSPGLRLVSPKSGTVIPVPSTPITFRVSLVNLIPDTLQVSNDLAVPQCIGFDGKVRGLWVGGVGNCSGSPREKNPKTSPW